MNQIDSCKKNLNEKGFETRSRYYEATNRFCGFLAKEFHSQKFINISEKHIKTYVQHMKQKGYSASTIKTDLSGIRFFYGRMNGKHQLPSNIELGLEERQIGRIDRAWTFQEIRSAKILASNMDRPDVVIAIDFGRHFGVRLNELCTISVDDLKNALYFSELHVTGKGGQDRAIPVETQEQKDILQKSITFAQKHGRSGLQKFLAESIRGGVKAQKKSIQNWIGNHRDKFMARPRESDKFKKVSERVSFHGCRHAYAQDRYDTFINRGMTIKQARYRVSEELGHHREDITKTYAGSRKQLPKPPIQQDN